MIAIAKGLDFVNEVLVVAVAEQVRKCDGFSGLSLLLGADTAMILSACADMHAFYARVHAT